MANDKAVCACLERRRFSKTLHAKESKTAHEDNEDLEEYQKHTDRQIGTVVDTGIHLPKPFLNKKALITGATKGIGRNIAKQLYFMGAQIVATGRTDEELKLLTYDIPGVYAIQLDLSDWKMTVSKLSYIGDIDFLVNCAGTFSLGSVINLTEKDFDFVFDLNVKSLINTTKIIAKNMRSRKIKGSIVNISSAGARAGIKRQSLYCASKGAVEAFTRAAALELAGDGIRINCVCPVAVNTRSSRKVWSNKETTQSMLAKVPLKRFTEVKEVTEAVIFLLGTKSSMITGCCLSVDGGFLAC